jgi:glycolate oxidase FAD binding subunit
VSERIRKLAGLLRSVVGDEQVVDEPSIKIDGIAPGCLVTPDSSEEVAACLRLCGENEAAVVPAGFATWLETGNPLRRADVVLSLERMNRVVDYSPADLTVTVEAGVSMTTLNEVARVERQWLPLDPPGSHRATLGALAACSSNGSLRLGFGAPRDYVIGLRLAHSDGTESRSGGKVVKNVAGYDLNKLYVGSFGTLAVLTELTFKLRPLPESSATAITVGKRDALIAMARRILSSDATPASLFLTKGVLTPAMMNAHEWALLIRFADNAVAVEDQVSAVSRLADGDGSTVTTGQAEPLWAAVADIDSLRLNTLRLSVPRSVIAQAVEEVSQTANCVVAADMGLGTIRLAFDAGDDSALEIIGRLRGRIAGMGGSLVVESAALAVRALVDAWGGVGNAAGLMRAIKSRFDPHSLLNPGRFVCHL